MCIRDRRCIRLAVIGAVDHIAVRELGTDLAPLPLNDRPRKRGSDLLRNRLGREQLPLLSALPPGALTASELRARACLLVIMIPRSCHSLPRGFGICIAGEDHILEWQRRTLPLCRHLQGALVASEGVNPEIPSLDVYKRQSLMLPGRRLASTPSR